MGDVGTAAEAVNALSDRFWNGILDLSPITATLLGYEQGRDRLDDPGPVGRDKARSHFRETLAQADVIEAEASAGSSLPREERITLDILRVICTVELEQQEQRFDRLKVVDQMEGPQTILPMLAAFQTTDTPEKLDLFIARLADYPRFMAANTELVQEGLAKIKEKFASPDHVGPKWVADFDELTDEEARAIRQRDAFERVNGLLVRLGVNP